MNSPIYTGSDDRLSPSQAADLIGVRVQTLAAWRCVGRHDLPFTSAGGRVYYSRRVVHDWLASRTGTSTSAVRHAIAR